MVSTCCAFGCTYRHNKEYSIGLFRFPQQPARRQAWICAIRRKNWKPNEHSRVCGHHFKTGKPSKDPDHPDYVPNVFSFTKGKKGKRRNVEQLQYKETKIEKARPKIIVLEKCTSEESEFILPTVSTVQESFVTEGNSEYASYSEIINSPAEELLVPKEEYSTEEEYSTVDEQQATRENSVGPIEALKNITAILEPNITMSLSAYQTTISELKAENERLQDELRRSKIDNMVDIALEMSNLRDEIRTLKDKLSRAQFTTLLMNDLKKFQYYTGLQDFDTFNNVLKSSKDLIDAAFTIPEETQLLIVLIKLKMKFQDEDLGVRFNVSRRTIRRVLDTWLPILSLDTEEE